MFFKNSRSHTLLIYITLDPNIVTFACLKSGWINSSRCSNAAQFKMSWKRWVLLLLPLMIFFLNCGKGLALFPSCPIYKTTTATVLLLEILPTVSGRNCFSLYVFVQQRRYCTSSRSHFLYLEVLSIELKTHRRRLTFHSTPEDHYGIYLKTCWNQD